MQFHRRACNGIDPGNEPFIEVFKKHNIGADYKSAMAVLQYAGVNAWGIQPGTTYIIKITDTPASTEPDTRTEKEKDDDMQREAQQAARVLAVAKRMYEKEERDEKETEVKEVKEKEKAKEKKTKNTQAPTLGPRTRSKDKAAPVVVAATKKQPTRRKVTL